MKIKISKILQLVRSAFFMRLNFNQAWNTKNIQEMYYDAVEEVLFSLLEEEDENEI